MRIEPSLGCLPTDIHRKLFEYLELSDTSKPVCSWWTAIHVFSICVLNADPRAKPRRRLCTLSQCELMKIVKRYPRVHTAILCRSSFESTNVLSAMDPGRLRVLDISYTDAHGTLDLCQYTKLQCFRASNTKLSEFVAFPKSLRELDLTGTNVKVLCTMPRGSELRTCALGFTAIDSVSSLANCQHLQSLDMSWSSLKSLKGLGRCSSLEVLNLAGCRQLPSDLRDINTVVSVRKLILNESSVKSLRAIGLCAALEHLEARETAVQDASPLQGLKLLEYLDLSETLVDNVSALRNCNCMQSLFLSQTGVSELNPLASMFRLKELYLCHTLVSDVSALGGCYSLRSLHLGHTFVHHIDSLPKLNLQALSLPRRKPSRLLF